MKRGDVFDVQLPVAGGTLGHEQQGRRPGIVLSSNQAIANLSVVLVVPVTKQLKALSFMGAVLIAATPGNGLDMDSVALPFQLRALDKSRCQHYRGSLSKRDLAELERQVKALLGM